jgi:hypothetical protein
MSKLIPIPFCGGSFSARTPNAQAQRSVNFRPVLLDAKDGTPPKIVLYPTEGRSLLVDLVGACIRGMYEYNGTLYAVKDNTFYSINSNGVTTTLGTLLTTTGLVDIECNTVQLGINDGTYAYSYNLSSGAFAKIADVDFSALGVTNFTYHDGYIIGVQNNSRRCVQSDLLDLTSWNALAFTDELTFQDNLVACKSDQLQLFLFGRKGSEVRFNSGGTPFAFDKVQNGAIQYGCAAKYTIKKLDNSLFWLARDEKGQGLIVRLDGYTPRIVSDAPLNDQIQSYGDVSDAYAYVTKDGNSQFYNLTFPTANKTHVYDAANDKWFEKSSFGIGRDRASCAAFFNNKTVIGDYFSGKIYYQSNDYLDDNGDIIQRVRVGQHQRTDNTMMFLYELIIDIESGVGTISGQGASPLATLEISKDGGHTWISYGTASMGEIGEYRRQLKWKKINARAKIFTFRVTITDPVRCYILGAWARATIGGK